MTATFKIAKTDHQTPPQLTNRLHPNGAVDAKAHMEVSSIKITGDIYTSIFADVDRAAAEVVAELVPRAVMHPHALSSPGTGATVEFRSLRDMIVSGRWDWVCGVGRWGGEGALFPWPGRAGPGTPG
jgi:hypothetical protein